MRGIRIGRVAGIPVQLNWTFLLVLPLFAYLIGSQVGEFSGVVADVFGVAIPADALTAGTLPWVLGTAAALGLFVSVLFHEFGHSLTAMRYGHRIEAITLWLFGGVAQFEEMPEDWRQEFAIAVMGPVVSVALGVVAYGVLVGVRLPATVAFVVGYLALMNLVLAAFNMLPGFPMDGGRVLRALLARKRPHARATRIAAEVGKVFAFLLGLVGLFGGNWLTVGLAFFVYIAASSEAQQTVMRAAFQDVTVADVMTPRERLHTVAPRDSVSTLMERMFRERHTGYPVMNRGRLVGMVTLEDAQGVSDVERDAYTVSDVMASDVVSVAADDDALVALETMQKRDVGRLAVVDADDELVGLVSRTDLMTAFDVIKRGGRESLGLGGDSGRLPDVGGRGV
ncbi:metalloprotease [Halobacteriales archaeon QS_6_71_20]|nr:MAG: metalloprotease [Halobacteriales archaeon QS_6_71_20]